MTVLPWLQGVHSNKSRHRLLLPNWIWVPNMKCLQLQTVKL